MPYVQLSHKMFVICINNRQNQIFSEMSLRDVMELPYIYPTELAASAPVAWTYFWGYYHCESDNVWGNYSVATL